MNEKNERGLTRDQKRASVAYAAVGPATESDCNEEQTGTYVAANPGEKQVQPAARDRGAGKGPGLSPKELEEYALLVHDLGSHIMRSGLSATLSFIERRKADRAVTHLLNVLASAELPHLKGIRAECLTEKVRQLRVTEYMLVTREVLALSVWMRRAVQARAAAERATNAGGASWNKDHRAGDDAVKGGHHARRD